MTMFKKKTRRVRSIIDGATEGGETPGGQEAAPRAVGTFSNPFGLGMGSGEAAAPAPGTDGLSARERALLGRAAAEVEAYGDETEEEGLQDGRGVHEEYEEREAAGEAYPEAADERPAPRGGRAWAEDEGEEDELPQHRPERPADPRSSLWTVVSSEPAPQEAHEAPPVPQPAGRSDSLIAPARGARPQAMDQGMQQGLRNESPCAGDASVSAPRPEKTRDEILTERINALDQVPARLAPEPDDRVVPLSGYERLAGQAGRPQPSDWGEHPAPDAERSALQDRLSNAFEPVEPVDPSDQGDPEDRLPAFAPVSPGATRPTALDRRGGRVTYAKLWEAFTPSRPKYSSRFFAGRRWAIQRVITAVEQDQAHVIIYGPRGIGKTSLANVLAESASEVEYEVLRYPCSSDTTFEEIFRGLLRSLPADYMDRATQAKFSQAKSFEQLLPDGEFGPTELTDTLSQLQLEHAILIIDEFDRVESDQLKNQLAESIKNLSDASARVTFIIVGIARSLDDLIGMHPSIQRHLVGIHLPLMESSELDKMILAGEKASGIRFEDATRGMIVSFSKGLPYYAQLLSLHAGRSALERGSDVVEMVDLKSALEKVLKEADPLAKKSYELATRDETDAFVVDVLFAAATAPYDAYGSFTVEDAAAIPVQGSGKSIPLKKLQKAFDDLAEQKDARIIDKWIMPAEDTRYSFVLQTMRQYVLLRQAARRGLM